jgi:hypothetical protein
LTRPPSHDDLHVTGGLLAPAVRQWSAGASSTDVEAAPHVPTPSLTPVRAVQITRFGGPEVLDIVDIPEPEAGPGQKVYDVSTAGVNYADTHQVLS